MRDLSSTLFDVVLKLGRPVDYQIVNMSSESAYHYTNM